MYIYHTIDDYTFEQDTYYILSDYNPYVFALDSINLFNTRYSFFLFISNKNCQSSFSRRHKDAQQTAFQFIIYDAATRAFFSIKRRFEENIKEKKAQNEKVGLPPLYEFDTFCRFVLAFMMAIAFVECLHSQSSSPANNRFPVCCPILPSCQLSTLLPTSRNRI